MRPLLHRQMQAHLSLQLIAPPAQRLAHCPLPWVHQLEHLPNLVRTADPRRARFGPQQFRLWRQAYCRLTPRVAWRSASESKGVRKSIMTKVSSTSVSCSMSSTTLRQTPGPPLPLILQNGGCVIRLQSEGQRRSRKQRQGRRKSRRHPAATRIPCPRPFRRL